MNTITPNGINVHDYRGDNDAIGKKGARIDNDYEIRGDKDTTGATKKVNNYERRQREELVQHQQSGLYADVRLKVMTGQELSKSEMAALKEMALYFTPEFLNRAAANGDITQQDADMLIMAGALLINGVGEQDLGRSLANFSSLNEDHRAFALSVASDRTVEYDAKVKEKDLAVKKITYTETHSMPNAEQARLSVFLENMRPGQEGHIQNFTNWHFNTSNNALAATMSDMPAYHMLTETQRDAMVNYLKDLGNGFTHCHGPGHSGQGWGNGPAPGPAHGPVVHGFPHEPRGGPDNARPFHNPGHIPGHYPGFGADCRFGPDNIMGPGFLADMGVDRKGQIDLGSLMFQVMGDRIDSLDKQVREFADSVDERNKAIETNTNAITALRANVLDGGGAVNISNLTFTDSDGRTASVAGCLHAQGIIKDNADLSSLSQADIKTLIESLSAKNDTLNSEATSEMTKMQQHMDKYQQAVSMQTNFESKWHSMMQAITGNLNR